MLGPAETVLREPAHHPIRFYESGEPAQRPYEHPGSPELFDSIDQVEYPYDALLLANHGVITSGTLAQVEQACIEIESLSGLHLQLLRHNPNRLTE